MICSSELYYTNDDDGVHLMCKNHGDVKVGFFLSLEDFMEAWAAHRLEHVLEENHD